MPTFWLGNFWHPTNEALNASSIYHWLGKDSSFFLVSWSHSLLVSLMICGWKLEVHTCEYHLLGDYCHHTANNLLVNSKNHLKSPVIFGVLCRKYLFVSWRTQCASKHESPGAAAAKGRQPWR